MKAISISKAGSPDVLQVKDVDIPTPTGNEVLISIKAAGVNRPDIAQRQGKYPPPPGAPADIPGLEVAGIIAECGSGVSRWKKGDEVCALLAGGGYADFALAHQDLCLPIPQGLSYTEAASLPETVFTVWHNVFQRAALQPGETFLVHGGSSGIGITAIQLAKTLGAEVYATAGTVQKCSACIDLGADVCINYKEQDFETVLHSNSVDVILDMVGGEYFQKNINVLRADGRLIYINAMKGNTADLNILQLMQKRIHISGSTLRNREITFKASMAKEIEKHVWPLIQSGRFKPVIFRSFDMQDASKAHQLIESSHHIGKIVLVND